MPIWTVNEIIGPPDLPPQEVVRRYQGLPDAGDPAQGRPPRTQINRDRGQHMPGTPDTWLVFDERCAQLHEFVVGSGWVPRARWIGEWAAAPVCPAP